MSLDRFDELFENFNTNTLRHCNSQCLHLLHPPISCLELLVSAVDVASDLRRRR